MKRRTKISLAILLGLLVTLLVLSRFFRMSVVIGQSMDPTLETWDYCVSRRVNPYQPRRGDIVTFRTADDPPLYFIKRVIALPGETLAIEHGLAKINGQPLPEPYTTVNPRWDLEPTRLPDGKIYVLSDNRTNDMEDYVQGMVAVRLVQSRLLWHWRWRGLRERFRVKFLPAATAPNQGGGRS